MHSAVAEVFAELEESHPGVDWSAVRAATPVQLPPEELADVLIDFGCDPEAVKRYVLDD